MKVFGVEVKPHASFELVQKALELDGVFWNSRGQGFSGVLVPNEPAEEVCRALFRRPVPQLDHLIIYLVMS